MTELAEQYSAAMDSIFQIYGECYDKLTKYLADQNPPSASTPKSPKNSSQHSTTDTSPADHQTTLQAQALIILQAIVPAAAQKPIGLHLTAQQLEKVFIKLQANPLDESQNAALSMLAEARKIMPLFLEDADKPSTGGSITAYLAESTEAIDNLAAKAIPQFNNALQDDLILSNYWPKNEMDIIPDILFDRTNISRKEITKFIADWPYNNKLQALLAFIGQRQSPRHIPDNVFSKVSYSWEVSAPVMTLMDMLPYGIIDSWQQITPRYGFDIPAIVESAGLSDHFERAFDTSASLYSSMQAAGMPYEAQYAVLLGHMVRFSVTHSAEQAYSLYESLPGTKYQPETQKLLKLMHQSMAEVHPVITESLRFINSPESPEIKRQAANLYKAYKARNITGDK